MIETGDINEAFNIDGIGNYTIDDLEYNFRLAEHFHWELMSHWVEAMYDVSVKCEVWQVSAWGK